MDIDTSTGPENPPTLSKSWAVARQHIPTFTGGKIVHSKHGLKSSNESNTLNFLLLPVAGDVAIVDAAKGTTLGTLRKQSEQAAKISSGNIDEQLEDEEDDEIDMDAITCFALSHNDRVIVACSRNNIMRQYHLTNPEGDDGGEGTSTQVNVAELVRVWGKSGHTLPVTQMEFHLSSAFLATGSVDGTVRIWDGRSPQSSFLTHLFSRPRHVEAAATIRGSVTALSWYPDHSQLVLAIGRDDGTLAIHDMRKKDNAPLAVMSDHDSAVTGCDWFPSQGLFVSVGRDAVINVWRGIGSSYTRIHTLPIYEQIEDLAILRQTKNREIPAFLTAGSKGMVRLWHIEEDGRLQLWKEQPNGFGEDRGGYLGMFYHKKFDSGTKGVGMEQIIVADAEHNLSFLSLTETSLLARERTLIGHNDDVLDIRSLPNNKIAVATNSAQVRLFDLTTFSCSTLDGHSATVLALDISPCGRYLATSGKDHHIRLWHIETTRCVAIASGHAEAVGSTALSRKAGRYEVSGKAAKNGGGSFMVSVSVDRTLKRWNLPGSEELNRIAIDHSHDGNEIALHAVASVRAHEKDINIVSVAPNDSLIATGSQDKSVKIWKATDLSLVATLNGHRRGVWDCQFSPYDRVLATASGDKTIKLWSLGDYGCVRTFQGHVASVLRVRFLNHGLQMVSSGADSLVKTWTIRTNECETTMEGHSDKVWALDLVGGGKQLVTGGADSRIILWTDNTVEVEASKRAEEEDAIVADQMLANHLRRKEYSQALEISLDREKPHHALRVFNAIIENQVHNGKDTLVPIQTHVASWNEDRLVRVLKYCRDWNTKARNCEVALLVVKAIVTSIPIHALATMKGVPEIIAGIVSYAERHFERLDRLYGSSFLLDFMLSAMGDLETSAEYDKWETSSKLVLPPKQNGDQIRLSGCVAHVTQANESDDEVVTLGDSDSSDDEEILPTPDGEIAQRNKFLTAAISDKSDSD
jgi:U3 small nucleolar RNA-associated protein 13